MQPYLRGDRTLELVTVAVLGIWAATTAWAGLLDVVNGVNNWRAFHAASGHGFVSFGEAGIGIWLLLTVVGFNAAGLAFVLGVSAIALRQRRVLPALVFGALVIAGPCAHVAINNWRNGGDGLDPMAGLVSWEVFGGGVVYAALGALVLLAGWLLLDLPARRRRVVPPSDGHLTTRVPLPDRG